DRADVRQGRHYALRRQGGAERGLHPHRLSVPGRGLGHRRPAQGADCGDLRAGVLRQDHPGSARRRGGPEAGRRGGLCGRRARPGPH
ncbi:HTH-type transcriptional regulator PuuR, partial [Dysosmobacter welbionis]